VDLATGRAFYDQVISFLNRSPYTRGSFVTIDTDCGQKLTLTPTHLLSVSTTQSAADAQMIFADEVRTGHYLQCIVGDGAMNTSMCNVTNISAANLHSGVYSPLTMSGVIVVDGVAASCYGRVASHRMAHAAMFPIRTAFTARKLLGRERYEWSSDLEYGEHPYTVALKGLGRWVLPDSWWY
jgi:hypothetical protein